MVKLAVLATGNVWDQAVEDGAVLLILVQPQIQAVAQKPAALGDAKAVGMLHVSGTGVALPGSAVLQKGPQVTSGEQPAPNNGRARGGINYLIDLAGHKPRGHVHMRGVWHHTA